MVPSGTPTAAPIVVLWSFEGRGLGEDGMVEEVGDVWLAELDVFRFVVGFPVVVADGVALIVEPVTPMVVKIDGVPEKCSGRAAPPVAEQSQLPRDPSCALQQ